MTWENVILTNFVWGEEILFALFHNTRELSADGHPISVAESLASQMVRNKAYTFHINATDNL